MCTSPHGQQNPPGAPAGVILLPVLNTDVGGADTASLAAGQSRAQLLKPEKSPVRAGFPLFEHGWKPCSFPQSGGTRRGIKIRSCSASPSEMPCLKWRFRALTPPQIEIALHEVDHSASTYTSDRGAIYASLEP